MQSTPLLTRLSDTATVCVGGKLTVRCVREWLESLPEEWQDTPFETWSHGYPITLKRIVAYTSKDGSMKGVTSNGMGTHLPFDDSLNWHHSLS